METLHSLWQQLRPRHPCHGPRSEPQSQGQQRLACLPLVRWRGREALEELIRHACDLGCLLFNPHAITVEDGGLGGVDADQVAAKANYDPAGLLNPGKLRGWLERSASGAA